ncbi:hypothetical protein RHGRI_036277 [Rhododendron griersonianum]|uniref:RING-type domain-containing protein n=1 Tax=Rhododendron griersonianum TaxID=479676 RepID=A0AAV6HT27_9ERIC|nr:hypothetical protein RHGRI_036277 [Rhododendron griersonianum]
MGFDNECIVNIQSLAGEYFCPVCRLLVYPNEALQSQCTHLYCKPCLTYVVGTTRACPYDGYLVTEADSKGPLSECSSHCSGCAFGNSPVVCNRCAIQIVHRQVQEHAQTCPGVPQTQQAEGVQDAAAPATSSNPHQTQTANQPGGSNSQAQASQTVAAPPSGQIPSTQAIASSQAMAVAPAPVPTPEQLYQQQYQQYYQQYPGYDPYQQAYQHYYPQQAVQQYQQHPPHVPVQHQSQVYSQPQAQGHLQPQAQVQPQTHPLPPTQPPQAQPQPIQHVQAPVAVQTSVNPQHQHHAAVQHPTPMQSQAHPPPHGHPQLQTQPQPYPMPPHSQQPMQMPQYQQPQSQFQHPQPQIPPQPPLQTLPHPQPQAHLQAQPQAPLPHPHSQLQPPPVPNLPLTQYPQAHAVTGNQSYPQPQVHQQVQLGAQHPPHMHVQSGPISQHHVQMPGQFPQQPPQLRPPQSHAPVPNQQRPALLPPQGQFPNVPSVQQPIHPHVQQPSHPGQRSVVLPNQQPMPQHVQHQQAFPVQTSAPVQSQLHPHGNLVQQQQFMQAQLRPQGPPHSMQQNSVAYMSSQQNVAPSHGLPPHQSQNYAARPAMPNGTQAQLFPQNPGFAGAAQVRPMHFSGNQSMTNQNYGPRTNNQMHMVSEQHVQSGLMTSKPTGAERHGDHMPVKSLADQNNGSPSHRTAQNEPNGSVPGSSLGALSVEVNNLQSETDVQKPISGDEDNKIHSDVHGKDSGSDLHAAGNGSSEPANKHLVKTEGGKSRLESSPGIKSVEIGSTELKDATDAPQRGEHSTGDDTSLLPPEASKDQTVKLQKDAVDAGMLEPGGAAGVDRLQHGSQERNLSQSHGPVPGKGFMPPPHHFPPTDQGRHQHMAMHYGPSNHQQAAVLPGPPYRSEVPGQPPNFVRPQGPSHLPTPGGIPGPSSAGFGQVPGHFGPPDRPFEPHYNQSHVPPPHAGLPRMSQGEPPSSFIMGRAPPHGTEGQLSQQPPINTIGSDNFSKQRPRYLDGGQPDSQLIGSSDRAPFGQSHGIDSNAVRMKEGAGIDSSAPVGFRGERFKHPTEEGLSRFPTEPAWRNDRGEFAEDLKQFPRHPHFDTEPPSKFGNYHSSSRFNDRDPLVKAPHGGNYDAGLQLDPGAGGPRFLPLFRPGGPNDARPVGPDGNIGRADSAHPDFLGPVPGFGRHHMDRPTPRSPGREYPGFPPRDFGGLSGFSRNQSGMDDIDGPRPFGGGPRTFNFPPDPAGNSFHENRFPLLPGHLRRGEFDGPDILPSHLRRGEFLGPRNLPGHSRFGEPAGFGGFTGHSRMGELDGPGNFLRHQPFGEPFGSNNSGHPRLGEPGFRSSYSATGGMDPFEHSRKRKSSTMGWCRICKVDCETVEGLDLHSQTRDHQKMAMDMVQTIKQQNKKRQKTSHDKSPAEEPSKLRGSGTEARGNKP